MKKILKFLISGILSTLIFSLVFLNSIQFSIGPIFQSMYDYASPTSREKFIKNIIQTCQNLRVIISIPGVENTGSNIDKEKLMQVCESKLVGRELFVEFLKSQTGDFKDIMNKNPDLRKYFQFFEQKTRFSIIFVALVILFGIFLFFVEGSFVDFLKETSKILLKVSILLILIYLLPKLVLYFLKPDTSFLFEVEEESVFKVKSGEVVLILLPIILDKMLTGNMLIFGGIVFVLSIIMFLIIRKKNNNIINS